MWKIDLSDEEFTVEFKQTLTVFHSPWDYKKMYFANHNIDFTDIYIAWSGTYVTSNYTHCEIKKINNHTWR